MLSPTFICRVCHKGLTLEECAVSDDGEREDMCEDCDIMDRSPMFGDWISNEYW